MSRGTRRPLLRSARRAPTGPHEAGCHTKNDAVTRMDLDLTRLPPCLIRVLEREGRANRISSIGAMADGSLRPRVTRRGSALRPRRRSYRPRRRSSRRAAARRRRSVGGSAGDPSAAGSGASAKGPGASSVTSGAGSSTAEVDRVSPGRRSRRRLTPRSGCRAARRAARRGTSGASASAQRGSATAISSTPRLTRTARARRATAAPATSCHAASRPSSRPRAAERPRPVAAIAPARRNPGALRRGGDTPEV